MESRAQDANNEALTEASKSIAKDVAIDALKDSLIAIAVQGVMKYLASRWSFFSVAIVNPLTELFVKKILTVAVLKTELGLYIRHIDQYTEDQANRFIDAAEKKNEAEQNGTEEEIAQAEQDLIDRARDLIRLDR